MRLERRENREDWERMDHQDFQVSSIHQSIIYNVHSGEIMYKVHSGGKEGRNGDKNNTRHFPDKRVLHRFTIVVPTLSDS